MNFEISKKKKKKRVMSGNFESVGSETMSRDGVRILSYEGQFYC